jgi:RNA polymerase sigma-70 factor (ECF subfamily)
MSESFECLINDNYQRIRNITFSYADYQEREDLTQEILAQLWRSREHFKGDASQSTWLYRIALNTAITYQRKKISDRKLNTISEDSLPKGEQNVSAESGNYSQEHILESFSAGLNKVDRAVFVMYVDGLNAKQMESILGVKANAIKVRISRLKEKFRLQFVDKVN